MRLELEVPGSVEPTTGPENFASRLFAHDASLWGQAAEAEARVRLGWTDLPTSSRPLVDIITALRADLQNRGLTHVVLCGMGGSSLAPEVICSAAGVPLTVLDSSHPDMVRDALADRLEESVVVVSSKSGGTVETDSLLRAYVDAFEQAGLRPADHLVIVTDPGSPFDRDATAAGYLVIKADPDVGGRYSALSAFGLVPSGLAGVDIGALLDGAAAAREELAVDSPDNPAVRLGTALASAHDAGVDKLVLHDLTGVGLGDWIEQLVAESTGKAGRGILPVVVPSDHSVNFDPSVADGFMVVVGGTTPPDASSGYAAAIEADLGAQFLLWEAAVAVTGAGLGINPFDQPDVESAKQAARKFLDSAGTEITPADLQTDAISAYGTSSGTLEAAVDDLLGRLDPERGYVAVQAYLDRLALPEYAELRELLAARTGRPVTFGWGPRFLHSTGQLHKGGPATGVYLQLTDDAQQDLDVPGRAFTFGQFIAAQSAGDAQVLQAHRRPLLRLHLANAATALPELKRLLA
ncbi:MAG TPA: glucose-6-phosphate isomerase [Aeromicrobium sp.]|nr:glucose-6-phosphate isomerase [Aeromicrobium sp.]HKY56458.1 glucose-6-phosphate isomerase [Aeromicrobium sp.]